MISLGDDKFQRLPKFGAKLYNSLMQISPVKLQLSEIAHDLTSVISKGRLLDVGTGPGRLFLEIHKLNHSLELFGLDISASMIEIAKRNLSGLKVDLRKENITRTSYESNYFDIVTSTGSLYLWDNPQVGIEEIYRILKEGQSAYLYEPYKDIDLDKFSNAFRANLQQVNILLKVFGFSIMKKIIRTAHRVDEYYEIIRNTSFAENFTIERVVLGNLPMWLRIELRKNL